MGRVGVLATLSLLLIAGCAVEEGLDEEIEDEGADGAAGSPEARATLVATEPSPTATPSTPPPTATPSAASPTPTSTSAAPDAPRSAARVTDGPAGDVDRDGILDATETSLATTCAIAGKTCAELGLSPPEVGYRDFVFVEVGRSGTKQDWRAGASVWASVKDELAAHDVRAQVADLGLRDDVDVEATWNDTANEGRYWHVWVLYDDPAQAIAQDTSGSQTYNLIKIAERESDLELRATILHEAYHALLGDLRGGRSACANEEIGGPGHSSDATSVLYTSPDCETNDGSVYRLSGAEAAELREEPFDVFRTMNAADWFTA